MSSSASWLALTGLVCALSLPTAGAATPLQDGADADASPTYLVRAKKVVVRPGHVLEDRSILVRDGRIVRIAAELAAPEGVEVLEGEVVCAGFIDPWSCLGVDGAVINDRSSDPATRTADGVDFYSNDHLRESSVLAGVTTARLQGGYRAAVGGQGAFVRLDPELDSADEAVLDGGAGLGMSIGLSIDTGPSFRRLPDGSFVIESGDRPIDIFDRVSAVDKVVALLETGRQYRESQVEYRHELEEWQKAIAEKTEGLEKDFKKAKKARDKDIEKAEEKGKEHKEKKYKEDKKPKQPKFDAEREVLARVAEGETPLVVEVHRAAELRNLPRGTRDLSRLRLVIAGGTEAMTCAEELAERRIPVIVWPSLRGTDGNDEFQGSDLGLAGRLAAAGVPVLLGSGGRDGAATRDLPLVAGLAVGHGLDADKALEALTLGAARTFDLADRVGSVEVGKDADLLILDGMPLESSSSPRHVLIGGRLVTPSEN